MELAIRRLVRAPLFVAAMVGTLAVGLGAFAVVATVVHQVLIAPLPYDNPDDLYFVWRDYRAFFDLDRGWLGGTDVAELQQAGGVIEDAAALLRQRTTLTRGAGVDPLEIALMVTSPNLFELLGGRPEVGRGFTPDETGPGRPPVIVLTHALWQQLGGDRSILDSEVRLNGSPFRVIGVLPRSFGFVRNASLGAAQRADAYIPLDVNLAETNPNGGAYAGLIRARRGASPDVVAQAVAGVARKVDERDFASRGMKLYPVGLQEDLVATVRPALVVLGLAGVFLVLVLMVNLATLLLARATQREKEFAVSRALGANRLAVVRATLLEGGLLGMLGGATGALAAVWGTRLLVALAPADLPRREFIAMDWTVALVIIGIGALLGLMAAALPATWAARTSLATLLGNTAVRGGGGHSRMRRGMVVVQVALSLVLLATGGLVVRSFDRLLRADPGFDPEGVLTVRVPVSAQRFPEPEDALALHDRMHAALAAIPGVSGVSATDALPLSAGASQNVVRIPGAPGNTGDPEHDAPLVDYIGVRAGYFDVMRMRLRAGRGFDESRREGVREAVIDHVLGEYFFPGANALGAMIPFDEDSLTIVGIVEQARLYDVHRNDRPQLYIRAEDWGYYTLSWAIRSSRPPNALVREVRAAIHGIDPQLALAEVRPVSDVVRESLSQQRVSAVLVGGFALGGLLLAAMGLFGVVSAAVTRRRHELAVRLALGAQTGGVLRLVIGDAARLVMLGLLIGVPATFFASRAISGALVGVSPSDPLTLSLVAALLVGVALIACYVPARRVLHIQPAVSLRNDSA
jgi:putative ABC transport system permease protein